MNRNVLSLVALLSVLSLSLSAQITLCPPIADDGLNQSACCVTAQPNIPVFGTISLPGTYGCIENCFNVTPFPMRVTVDYTPLLCDVSLINVNAIPAVAGGPTMRLALIAKYARTFTEIDPTGAPRQIWRFLVNGDANYAQTTAAAVPCPVPATAVNNRPVHFFGSIDYFCSQGTTGQGFQVRLDLSHLPQCISNAPWSTRPLAAAIGPNISHHLMAPTFAFAPHAAPAGFAPGESQRTTRVNWAPFNWQCTTEKMLQGQISSFGRTCACGPLAGVVPFYEEQSFLGRVTCNGVTVPFTTVPFPGVTTSGMLTMTLGTYVASGTQLNVYWGLMSYTDSCVPGFPFHVVVGSGTTSPNAYRFFNTPVAGALLRNAIDLGNSLVLDTFPPAPGFGSPYVSTDVFNFSL